MKESIYKDYGELLLFLNAATVAKVLGVSPSSGYELMHIVVTNSVPCSENRQQARSTKREIRGVGVAAHSERCRLKYTPWLKRDPIKNYFQLPKEIFLLGLSPGALAVYSYLLCCENRNTYQC